MLQRVVGRVKSYFTSSSNQNEGESAAAGDNTFRHDNSDSYASSVVVEYFDPSGYRGESELLGGHQ